VGVWGFSQGGFIAPLVAERCSPVAFTILVSGAAVTPEKQELARVAQHLRADNFSEDDIMEAVEAMQQVNSYARTGLGWEDLRARYEDAVNRKVGWLSYLGGPLAPTEHWYWPWWRQVMDFEPLLACKQIKNPVLILLGELDCTVPVLESISLYKEAFGCANNPNFMIKVFPRANHGLRLAKTGGRSEYGGIQEYVQGYFEIMIEWILQLLKKE
jgi:pimeloyl-ACP methyl ester carboxylesterase